MGSRRTPEEVDTMQVQDLINGIKASCRKVLKENLVGIYLHGSLAFGCFVWERSDVDF